MVEWIVDLKRKFNNIDIEIKIASLIMFIVIILVVGLIFMAVKESYEWEKHKADHNCKKIGEMSGTVGIGVAPTGGGKVGPVVTTFSGKTGWACDDGMTYWR